MLLVKYVLYLPCLSMKEQRTKGCEQGTWREEGAMSHKI